ncbi:MAG: hypothetical protein CMJ77_00110 [Planctomycetaceae bacterium]|nr:hypothetical protein [Planctomycetaceae bacterium]
MKTIKRFVVLEFSGCECDAKQTWRATRLLPSLDRNQPGRDNQRTDRNARIKPIQPADRIRNGPIDER